MTKERLPPSSYTQLFGLLSALVSIKPLSAPGAASPWFPERMAEIHHLFNLLTLTLSLFLPSLHCSLIQSLPCWSLSLSLPWPNSSLWLGGLGQHVPREGKLAGLFLITQVCIYLTLLPFTSPFYLLANDLTGSALEVWVPGWCLSKPPYSREIWTWNI